MKDKEETLSDKICKKCNKKKSEHGTGWGKIEEYCSFHPNIRFEPKDTAEEELKQVEEECGGVDWSKRPEEIMNKELFDESMKEARDLLKPHIKYAEPGDDNLIIELAFIIFKYRLEANK